MYGIKSSQGRWSVSLCNCSQDTAHFHYGNVVLHIARDDLRELGLAMQSVAEDSEPTDSGKSHRAKERSGPIVMSAFIAIIIKGGIVMIPLLACSLISLALTIERFVFWAKLKTKDVLDQILSLVEKGEFEQALKLGKNSSQPIARVLAAGIAHRNPAPAKAMEALAQAEIPVLKSRLGVLDTIVTLAPLLGLLGTVVGMIGSFDVMSEAGMGQPHAITGGVAEALIATATGLLIAILTLVSYNYFTAKVEREMDRMEHFSSSLELLLHERAGKH